ncbi:MAG: hypothetical protein JWM73_2345 [Solirubrobacterales bacterium]|jgi:hypothetical protein|nr:hypothetical protein [Solirubrobacterales bacterium]
MGFVFTVTIGLIVWIVLWALGSKSIDAFMITTVVVLLGATARMLVPFLPGRND